MDADETNIRTGASSMECCALTSEAQPVECEERVQILNRPSAKILLVDDEPWFRVAQARLLRRQGYRVFEASNGKEAERVFLRDHPDLIITDMCMPERDGLDTIRRMGEMDPLVPVIAMSGSGRLMKGDCLAFAHYLGVVRTLEKPFSMDELLAAVRSALPFLGASLALAE